MPKAPTSSFEAEKSVRKVQPDVSPEKWRKLGPAEPWGHALFFLGRWESESVGGSKWWRVKMANLFAAFCSQLLKSPAGPCHGHEVEISDELTADSKSRGLNMYVTYVLVGFFSHQRHCKGTERERERERGKFYTDLTMESVFCNFFWLRLDEVMIGYVFSRRADSLVPKNHLTKCLKLPTKHALEHK